jgi:hypothetical protein
LVFITEVGFAVAFGVLLLGSARMGLRRTGLRGRAR